MTEATPPRIKTRIRKIELDPAKRPPPIVALASEAASDWRLWIRRVIHRLRRDSDSYAVLVTTVVPVPCITEIVHALGDLKQRVRVVHASKGVPSILSALFAVLADAPEPQPQQASLPRGRPSVVVLDGAFWAVPRERQLQHTTQTDVHELQRTLRMLSHALVETYVTMPTVHPNINGDGGARPQHGDLVHSSSSVPSSAYARASATDMVITRLAGGSTWRSAFDRIVYADFDPLVVAPS